MYYLEDSVDTCVQGLRCQLCKHSPHVGGQKREFIVSHLRDELRLWLPSAPGAAHALVPGVLWCNVVKPEEV